MAFERERKDREGDVFCLFRKVWVNELASCRNCKDLRPVAADGQNLSSKGRGSRENQTGRERQTDRHSDRYECQSQLRCRLDVCRPSRDPCSHGGVCAQGCAAGPSAPVLAQAACPGQPRLNKNCSSQATGSLPSDTLVESEHELVRFSVAGDGGEESKGEKEERRGVG